MHTFFPSLSQFSLLQQFIFEHICSSFPLRAKTFLSQTKSSLKLNLQFPSEGFLPLKSSGSEGVDSRHSEYPFFQGIVHVTVPCQNTGTVPFLNAGRNSSFLERWIKFLYTHTYTHQMQNQPLTWHLALYILKLILHHFTAPLNYLVFLLFYYYIICLNL